MIAKSLSLRHQLQLQGRDNFLQAGHADVDKLNDKRQLDSLSDMSCSELDSVLPTFSTPVRASFRRRMPRTSVAFHLVSNKFNFKAETSLQFSQVFKESNIWMLEKLEIRLKRSTNLHIYRDDYLITGK